MAEEPNGSPNLGLPEKAQTLDAVLVAEDDPVFRHVLEYWLKKWDYRVTSVENGLDAWNILQKVDSPQMAILDWMMPAMDGVELCRRLRRQEGQRYHFVLLVTSKDDKQDVVAGLSAGADDYLTKPFNVDELRARIRTGERILHLQDALIRAHEALRFEAAHDPLTGLWNRGAILELLEREVQLHQRTGSALGLMMVDLDRFKQVNDTQGHMVGDVVLRESAHRMAASVRNYDWVGRYGGEEFLIVVPGCDADALLVERGKVACLDCRIAGRNHGRPGSDDSQYRNCFGDAARPFRAELREASAMPPTRHCTRPRPTGGTEWKWLGQSRAAGQP